jgi:hypothetical protein
MKVLLYAVFKDHEGCNLLIEASRSSSLPALAGIGEGELV